VRKLASVHKPVLEVKDGIASGMAHLVAKAVARVGVYYWQYSLDGKAWTSWPETLKASVVITGLTPAQTYSFRLRTLTRAGASDYSQVVAHLVK
jgi:hypothetical protein